MKFGVIWSFGRIAVTLLAVIFVGACGTSGAVVDGYLIKANLDGLKLDESAAPTLLYVRPGAPSIESYSRFIVDPVLIDYTDPSLDEISPEDITRIQRYFQDQVIAELRDAGVTVATRSDSQTMRVSFSLSGLKAPSAAANVTAVAAPIAMSVGEVTVEAVFSEADSGDINAVVVATSRGSRVFNTSPWSTWADIEGALDQWAQGIRNVVVTNP